MTRGGEAFHEQVLAVESDLKGGEYAAAMRRGEDLLMEAPDHVPLLRIVGNAAFENGDLRTAHKYLARAAQHDTQRIRALLSLAAVLQKQGRHRRAERYLRRALKEQSHTPADHQKLVEAAVRLKDSQEVVRRATQALTEFPDHPEYASGWRKWLTQHYAKLRFPDEAWDELTARLESPTRDLDSLDALDLDDRDQVVAALIHCARTCQLDKALDLLLRTQSHCDSREWNVALARIMSMRARGIEFPFFYYETLELFPDNPYGYLMVGRHLGRWAASRTSSKNGPVPELVQALDFLLAASTQGEIGDDDSLLMTELVMGAGDPGLAECWLDGEQSRRKAMTFSQARIDALARLEHLVRRQDEDESDEARDRGNQATPDDTRRPTTLPSMVGSELTTRGEDPARVARSFSAYLNHPRVLLNLYRASRRCGRVDRARQIRAYAASAFPFDTRFADYRESRSPMGAVSRAVEPDDSMRVTGDSSGSRVLMLTYETHENDSRVNRAAETLSKAGHDVVLLAKHRFGLPVEERVGNYTVLRPQWNGRIDPSLVETPSLEFRPRLDLALRDYLHRRRRPAISGPWPWEPQTRYRSPTPFERRQYEYLAYATTAYEYARRYEPDVIHAHDFNTLVAAELINRVMGTPFVYDTHELWVHRNRAAVTYPRREIRWEETFERQAMQHASFSITVCDSIADHLAREYSIERPVVVRNIPERGDRPNESLHLRNELGLTRDTFLAVYVGRFTANRGIADIIRALPIADPRIRFAMVGYFDRQFETKYRQLVDELGVEDLIHTFGPVPSEEVSDWIRDADISLTTMNRVCLSYAYTLPNKLFESLHAGVPILGPDSPEIERIIREYGCGLTYRDGDHFDLAQNLDRLVANPDVLADLKQGAVSAARDLQWRTEKHRLIDAYGTFQMNQASSVSGRLPLADS